MGNSNIERALLVLQESAPPSIETPSCPAAPAVPSGSYIAYELSTEYGSELQKAPSAAAPGKARKPGRACQRRASCTTSRKMSPQGDCSASRRS